MFTNGKIYTMFEYILRLGFDVEYIYGFVMLGGL